MLKKYDASFQFLRPIIIFLYNFKCQGCKKEPLKFEVHHYDKNEKNNDPFNLFPLCVPCHKLVHSGICKFNLVVPEWLYLDFERLWAFVKRSYNI